MKRENRSNQAVQEFTTPARHAGRARRCRGVIFRAPLSGTVLAATAAAFPVQTRSMTFGTLVTAVGGHRWDHGNGLRYWVNGEQPPLAADKCTCKAGDS